MHCHLKFSICYCLICIKYDTNILHWNIIFSLIYFLWVHVAWQTSIVLNRLASLRVRIGCPISPIHFLPLHHIQYTNPTRNFNLIQFIHVERESLFHLNPYSSSLNCPALSWSHMSILVNINSTIPRTIPSLPWRFTRLCMYVSPGLNMFCIWMFSFHVQRSHSFSESHQLIHPQHSSKADRVRERTKTVRINSLKWDSVKSAHSSFARLVLMTSNYKEEEKLNYQP